jgi:hypothetical protein
MAEATLVLVQDPAWPVRVIPRAMGRALLQLGSPPTGFPTNWVFLAAMICGDNSGRVV